MARNLDELYRANILEHYKRPHHWGRLKNAQASHTESNPTCGDELSVDLQLAGGKVSNVGFSGAGCAISMAAASMLSDRIVGQTPAQLRKLDKQILLDDLGIDPGPSRLKCALLSWHALQKALEQLQAD